MVLPSRSRAPVLIVIVLAHPGPGHPQLPPDYAGRGHRHPGHRQCPRAAVNAPRLPVTAQGRRLVLFPDAVHPLQRHRLHVVLPVLVRHRAHRALLLGHLVVAVLQVAQQVREPDQLARADQRVVWTGEWKGRIGISTKIILNLFQSDLETCI